MAKPPKKPKNPAVPQTRTPTSGQPFSQATQTKSGNRLVGAAWSAPMPPPSLLKDYDSIVPGSAARIVEMATSEQTHRHEIERKESTYEERALNAAIVESRVGQFMGFTVTAITLSAAIWNTYIGGNPWITGLFLSPPVLGVVNVLMSRRKKSD